MLQESVPAVSLTMSWHFYSNTSTSFENAFCKKTIKGRLFKKSLKRRFQWKKIMENYNSVHSGAHKVGKMVSCWSNENNENMYIIALLFTWTYFHFAWMGTLKLLKKNNNFHYFCLGYIQYTNLKREIKRIRYKFGTPKSKGVQSSSKGMKITKHVSCWKVSSKCHKRGQKPKK